MLTPPDWKMRSYNPKVIFKKNLKFENEHNAYCEEHMVELGIRLCYVNGTYIDSLAKGHTQRSPRAPCMMQHACHQPETFLKLVQVN